MQPPLFGQPEPGPDHRLSIRELPQSDQPAYRAEFCGFGALSNLELLTLVGRIPHLDTAAALLRDRNLLDLARLNLAEMQTVPGIGPTTALAIKSALELARRLVVTPPYDRPQVKSPADAATVLMAEMQGLEQEHLVTMLLDSKNRVLRTHTVYIGSLNTAVVRVGELFREAIRLNSAALILAHNHPSGDPTPSPEDVMVTRQVVEAGKLLNIEVLDHVVIGQSRWVSLKERGLGF